MRERLQGVNSNTLSLLPVDNDAEPAGGHVEEAEERGDVEDGAGEWAGRQEGALRGHPHDVAEARDDGDETQRVVVVDEQVDRVTLGDHKVFQHNELALQISSPFSAAKT